jgi:hypothetical protein
MALRAFVVKQSELVNYKKGGLFYEKITKRMVDSFFSYISGLCRRGTSCRWCMGC